MCACVTFDNVVGDGALVNVAAATIFLGDATATGNATVGNTIVGNAIAAAFLVVLAVAVAGTYTCSPQKWNI